MQHFGTGSELIPQFDQETFHAEQRFQYSFLGRGGWGLFFAQLELGPFESEAFFFDKVEYFVEIVHIVLGEKAVSLLVALGFDDVELFFVEAHQRNVHLEHVGHFADAVIEFRDGSFAEGHVKRIAVGLIQGLRWLRRHFDHGLVFARSEVVEEEVDWVHRNARFMHFVMQVRGC